MAFSLLIKNARTVFRRERPSSIGIEGEKTPPSARENLRRRARRMSSTRAGCWSRSPT